MSIVPEKEFRVGAHLYRAARVDTFEQMNMASEFREALLNLALVKQGRKSDISDADFTKAVEFVITGGAARVQPEVRERVMRRCFRVVSQQQGVDGGWAPVMNAEGGLMFPLELGQSVRIMYEVFDHNGLLDFFSDAPSTSGGANAE